MVKKIYRDIWPYAYRWSTSYAIFTQMFDADVIETNAYYVQFIEKQGGVDTLPKYANAGKWTNVDVTEWKGSKQPHTMGIVRYLWAWSFMRYHIMVKYKTDCVTGLHK